MSKASLAIAILKIQKEKRTAKITIEKKKQKDLQQLENLQKENMENTKKKLENVIIRSIGKASQNEPNWHQKRYADSYEREEVRQKSTSERVEEQKGKVEKAEKPNQLEQTPSIEAIESTQHEIKKIKNKLTNLGLQNVPEITSIKKNITKLNTIIENLERNISIEKTNLNKKYKNFFRYYSKAKKDMENDKNKLCASQEKFKKILEVHQKALSILNNITKDFEWYSQTDTELNNILNKGKEICCSCSKYILNQSLGCGFINTTAAKTGHYPKDPSAKMDLIENIKNHIQSFESSKSKERMQSAINSMEQKYIEKVRNFEHLKTLCEQYDSLNKQLNEKKSNLLREKSIKRLVENLNLLKSKMDKMVKMVNENTSSLELKQAAEFIKTKKQLHTSCQLNVQDSIINQPKKAVNADPKIFLPVQQNQNNRSGRLSVSRKTSTTQPLGPLKEVNQITEMNENDLSYSANLDGKRLILQGNTYWCKFASFLTIAINKSKQNLEKLTKLGLDTSQALDSSKNQAFMSYIYNIKGYAPGRKREINNTTIANIEKLREFCEELHDKKTIVLKGIYKIASVFASFNLNAVQTQELKLIYNSLIEECGIYKIDKQKIADLIKYLSGTEKDILKIYYNEIKDIVPLYNCLFYPQLDNFEKGDDMNKKLDNIKELKKMYNYCKELYSIEVKIGNFIPGSGKDCQNQYLKAEYKNIEDKLNNLKKQNIELKLKIKFKKYLEKMLKNMEEIMYIFNKIGCGNSMTELEKNFLHSQLSYINELIPLYNLYTNDHIDFDSINTNLLRKNVEEGVHYLMKRRSKFSQEHIEFLNIYLELGCKFSKYYLIPKPKPKPNPSTSTDISDELVYKYFTKQFTENLGNPNNYIMLGFKKINHYCVLISADSKGIEVWDPINRKTTLLISEDKSSLSLPSFKTTLEKYYIIK